MSVKIEALTRERPVPDGGNAAVANQRTAVHQHTARRALMSVHPRSSRRSNYGIRTK
jgi:hypothetical protein